EHTLIVGPQGEVERLAREREGAERGPVPVFGLSPTWPTETTESMRDLYDAMAESRADAIVLVGALSDAALQAVMVAAWGAGAGGHARGGGAFRALDEPSFVLRRAEPMAVLSRPALVGSQLVLKRSVDVVGAVIGLLVLSPLFAAVAIAVRATSRGPIFFK